MKQRRKKRRGGERKKFRYKAGSRGGQMWQFCWQISFGNSFAAYPVHDLLTGRVMSKATDHHTWLKIFGIVHLNVNVYKN